MAGAKRRGQRGAYLAAATLAMALSACQGTVGGSPEGIPVALESIDGAPAPIRTALASEMATAASDRKVELVGSSAQARYRVRGYLTTDTTDGEAKVAYVWDVFDAQKRRAKRFEGSSPLQVSSGSMSELDKEALARLAQSSMDEIAEFLSASKAEDSFQTADASDEENPVATQ